jgi:hypothetical protein
MTNDFIGGSNYEGKAVLAPKTAFMFVNHNCFLSFITYGLTMQSVSHVSEIELWNKSVFS